MVAFLTANDSRSVPAYSATSLAAAVSTAGATDVFAIQGSSLKVVRLQKMRISGTSSANSTVSVSLLKRSSPNTGGTSTAISIVPHDSQNQTPVATVLSYSANPTTGTLVGALRGEQTVFTGTSAPNLTHDEIIFQFSIADGQTPALRGSSEWFCVNLNGLVAGSAAVSVDLQWTEE